MGLAIGSLGRIALSRAGQKSCPVPAVQRDSSVISSQGTTTEPDDLTCGPELHQQPVEWISRCRLEPSVRDARRRTDSKAVPVPRSVLDGDPSAFTGNPHTNRAPILLQRRQRLAGIQPIGQPGSHLVLSKIAES